MVEFILLLVYQDQKFNDIILDLFYFSPQVYGLL